MFSVRRFSLNVHCQAIFTSASLNIYITNYSRRRGCKTFFRVIYVRDSRIIRNLFASAYLARLLVFTIRSHEKAICILFIIATNHAENINTLRIKRIRRSAYKSHSSRIVKIYIKFSFLSINREYRDPTPT